MLGREYLHSEMNGRKQDLPNEPWHAKPSPGQCKNNLLYYLCLYFMLLFSICMCVRHNPSVFCIFLLRFCFLKLCFFFFFLNFLGKYGVGSVRLKPNTSYTTEDTNTTRLSHKLQTSFGTFRHRRTT